MESARLFLALWPDAALREGLACHRDAWRWSHGTKVVPTGRLHLTLHFIGSVSRHRLPLLGDALQVAFDPFALELGIPELWPRGVAVLCPLAIPAAMAQLHVALGDALQQQGWSVDAREFHPHVTLARQALGAAAPAHKPELLWRVTRYALMESMPGAGYRVERDFLSV